MSARIFCFLLVYSSIIMGCANISTPSGGKKDTIPPKLLSVSPADSLLNTRADKIVLRFDEYITVTDVQKEVEVSPILSIPPTVTGVNKHVTVLLADTLLEDNTTYRITFGSAIRDLHEGNIFARYAYTFSTGGYFDSLQLSGNVINAATGFPDTSGIVVVLYSASEDDSAIVKKKPRYKAKPDNKGNFLFKGLPGRAFRMYAVKDDNANLMYDGGSEMVAFNDSTVIPVDSVIAPVTLRLFAEIPDSAAVKDTVLPKKKGMKTKEKMGVTNDTSLTYTVNIDTSNSRNRTFDITDSIKLVFNHNIFINKDKIRISYDSADVKVPLNAAIRTDTSKPKLVYIVAAMAENKVYTLHLDTGFASDTGGLLAPPGRYQFRTFNDDDYGKIKLNLPGKYYGTKKADTQSAAPHFLLLLKANNDTLYQRRITDTVIQFRRLRPANYTFCIIVDKNKNGKWDTGDLLGKVQPEWVIPGAAPLSLKARFEHSIDFDSNTKPTEVKGGLKSKPKK
ncbi:MAG: Ig-like domain-containing protein [Taibaiella sp.]|nr:Ig-like domain-containing protein [Taibaiella sp.]